MRKCFARAADILRRHPSVLVYALAFLFPILSISLSSLLSVLINGDDFTLVFKELENDVLPLIRSVHRGSSLSDFFALSDPELRVNAYLLLISPLNLPMILAPLSALRGAMMLSLLLRLGLAGLSLAFFLRRIGCKLMPSLALSLCYALSSYAVVGATYPARLDVLILFPLVTLGILRIARGCGGALFGCALGLSMLLCPALAFSLAVFSVLLYGYFRIVIPCPRERSLCSIGVFVCALLLAILSALASLIPFLSYVSPSPSDYPFVQALDFLDFCAKLLPGSFDGLGDAAFPYLAVGVLPLLLSVVFFSTRAIPVRLRIATGGLWFLVYFSFSISAVNGFYSLFIPSLPLYGHAFFFVFLLTATGAYAWRHLSASHEKTLILSCGVIVFFAMLLQKLKPTYAVSVGDETLEYGYISELAILWIPMLSAILLTSALVLIGRALSRGRVLPRAAVMLVLLSICIEGALSCYALRGMAKSHRGQDRLADADFSSAFSDSVLSAIGETDENALYRVISSNALSFDDGLLFGYHSLTALPDPILSSLGISLDEGGCFQDADYPLALSLLGVRHYIERACIPIKTDGSGKLLYDCPNELPWHLRQYFDDATRVSGDGPNATTLFSSSLALPLLFASPDDLAELSLADADSVPTLLNAYFRKATGDGSLSLYNSLSARVSGTKGTQGVNGYTVYSNMTSLGIKTTVTSDAPLYFTVTTEYPRASTLSVAADGVTVATCPLYADSDADPSVTLPLGSFAEGTVLELSISFRSSEDGCFYLPDGASLLLQEDPPSIERAIELLSSRAATNLKISGDSLSAVIVTSGKTWVQTTLPADFGITVRVDGRRVEAVRALGEFLAIPIEGDGEHRITLTLKEPVGVLPTVLSAIGALMLAALAVLELLVFRGRLRLPYLSQKRVGGCTEVRMP